MSLQAKSAQKDRIAEDLRWHALCITHRQNRKRTNVIHISQHQQGTGSIQIHLEGTLDSVHVVALEDVLAEARARGFGKIAVDCRGLLAVDEAGAAFLSRLQKQGVFLLDLSVTVSWRLLLDTQSQRTA
jgi:anti-anti-sigma regulatory factor